MRVINVSKIGCGFERLAKKIPQRSDMGRLIDEPALILANGVPAIGYFHISGLEVERVRDIAIAKRGVVSTTRSRGLPTQSAVFGAMPRVPLRADYCRYTSNTKANKNDTIAMVSLGKKINAFYKQYFPNEYKKAVCEVTAHTNTDWHLFEPPYLSANINMNHAIPYHCDRGNFRSHFSNVLILKEGIDGGELVCPEYGLSFHQGDGFLLFFYGRDTWHGVMPIKKTPGAQISYRASIVYYTLENMKNCLCQNEEARRFQEIRTRKELVPTKEARKKLAKFMKQKTT